MLTPNPQAPQGAIPLIGIPNSKDIPRLVYTAPYFVQSPLAELIEPAVQEAVEAILPSLVPQYVDGAAQAAVQQSAVLLTGSSMSGPLMLSPLMPTADTMAASKAYVDTMVATAGVPEVPTVPNGQTWARQVGQWVPINEQTGVFLPISGGTMQGQINMSGNAITNLPAIPVMPNGAAPAQWVLNQLASVSLYQGTWNLDTNTPDLSAPSTHVNGYTWIAITVSTTGVVIGAAVPGLQGQTVYNGDHVVFSAAQGNFSALHAGGLTLPEADARYLQLAGGQLSGALLLNANATQPTQAVTKQQLDAAVAAAGLPEAPTDGQLYGRNGLSVAWQPVLPLAGGVLSGSLTLAANATLSLQAVPLQQLTATVNTAVSSYVPLAGGQMTGLLLLSGNAGANLNPVPLQQLNLMLGSYVSKAGDTMTGPLTGTVITATSLAAKPASGWAALNLTAPAAGNRAQLNGYVGTNQRWELDLGDGAAESTGNAGSNFGLARFNDAGTFIDFPLTINRATGNATFSGTVLIPSAVVGGTSANDPGTGSLYLAGPATGNGVITINHSTSGNNESVIIGQRGGSTRWSVALGSQAAETGSNVGSDLYIARYNDSGAWISNPLVINRATGAAAFSGNVTVDGGNIVLGAAGGLGIMYMGGASPNAGRIAANNTSISLQLPPGAGASSIIYSNPGIALHTVANTGDLTIAGTNAIKPGGGSWVAPSDMQLKARESIAAYTTGLDAIVQLQPVTYKYNGKAGLPTDQTFHGLIADDVETVMPEAVGRAVLGARPAMGEDEGDKGEEYRTFDQSPVLFALINCVKELKAELDTIKAGIQPMPTATRRTK